MNIIKLLFLTSRFSFFLTLICSLIAGISCTSLFTLINKIVSTGMATPDIYLLQFLISVTVFACSTFYSEYLLINFSNTILHQLRTRLSGKILSSELQDIQRIKSHRLLSIMTEDVLHLTNTISDLPTLFINVPVIIGCYLYLASISIPLFFGITGFIALIIMIYRYPLKKAKSHLRLSREITTTLYQHFENMIYGIKELLQNKHKKNYFYTESIQKDSLDFKVKNSKHKFIYKSVIKTINIIIFLAIGFLLFAVPQLLGLSIASLNSVILLLVFIIGPLGTCLNFLGRFTQAQVSLEQINVFETEFNATNKEKVSQDLTTYNHFLEKINEGKSTGSPLIKCEKLRYTYQSKESHFHLGPLSLTVNQNEIMFLIGGNGSGKTTFLHLLTGLYHPQSGIVSYLDTPISTQNRDHYRSEFAVVFSDFHLFEQFYHSVPQAIQDKIDAYLKDFKLDHVVSFKENQFSTIAVSQGQRKRLALIMELCLDKPIYVFDEWAADQDPEFKAYFYHHILQDLKKSGKTVIAITHDDHYFHCCDRVIKMDNGQLTELSEEKKLNSESLSFKPV